MGDESPENGLVLEGEKDDKLKLKSDWEDGGSWVGDEPCENGFELDGEEVAKSKIGRDGGGEVEGSGGEEV